ncbi:MAG: hypothetical protein WD825_15390 [Gemmatimonadaceae bacterium]
MPRVPDILVTSADDQPTLAVEVKNKAEATAQWAAELRRNLAVHAALPPTPFFMVAALDRFFLWRAKPNEFDAPPNYVVDALEILRPYSHVGAGAGHITSSYALELMVAAWLKEIIRSNPPRDDKTLSWLYESGLHDAIRQGDVRTQAPV